MNIEYLKIIRCPVTNSELSLQEIDGDKSGNIQTAILFAKEDWFYPVIEGIPRLTLEAFHDYSYFFKSNLPDYDVRKTVLLNKYGDLIRDGIKKNKRTKASFSQEWKVFRPESDKTWNLDRNGLINQFLRETDETIETIRDKTIFDAGCGNGQLDLALSEILQTNIIATDFSDSIVDANHLHNSSKLLFIQGDVQFPPVKFREFDIVHSSGVLIHTNNTELSLTRLDLCVKPGGKLSVWLYHPRKDLIHRTMNVMRRFTSRLPLKFQYYLYSFTLLPINFVIKKLKGNKQNRREMMIDILDWMTPEFRWEHTPEEAIGWFEKLNYKDIKITTKSTFGFNITGRKNVG